MVPEYSDLPIYSESEELGDKGVRIVEQIFCDTFKWIFRRQDKNDLGIDAQIEILGKDKRSRGKLLALQIKCGLSFFRETNDEGYIFRGENKHLYYWIEHSLPVILVICDPSTQKCFWVEVTRSNVTKLEKAWKITVPFKQVLEGDCIYYLEQIANQLRHDDIIELSLYKYLNERYNGKIKICPEICTPRDFHGLSYIAELNQTSIIIGFLYDMTIGFNVNDVKNYIDLYFSNMRAMAWDKYNKKAKFYFYFISESQDSLNLSSDIIELLKNYEFVEYFRMLYSPNFFYLLKNIDENCEVYFA